MSESESSGFESIDARDARALTECMTVCGQIGRARGADDLYIVVTESGSEYLVDVREGACECPDAQYNLPTEDGRQTCKHAARITYEAGMRPIPAWVDRDAVDDQLLAADHIDGEPVFAGDLEADTADESEPAIDAEATPAGRAIADGGEILEDDADDDGRPDECACVPTQLDVPCWPCWRAGHRSPNPGVGGEA